MNDDTSLDRTIQAAWRDFQSNVDAVRPTLYRYCRHLTRTPWDAEDLVQDTFARAFATLGALQEPPRDRRAWLFRVASNLWIDGVLPTPARLELRTAHGEPLLLSWYRHRDGVEAVRAVTRVELDTDGGGIARMWNYFFTPEVTAEVCGELGLPHRSNGTFSGCIRPVS